MRPTLPRKLDQVTMVAFDHVGNRQRFSFRIQLEKGFIPPTFITSVRAEAATKLCANKMNNSLPAGIEFEYSYRDAQANPLGAFVLKEGDCKSVS